MLTQLKKVQLVYKMGAHVKVLATGKVGEVVGHQSDFVQVKFPTGYVLGYDVYEVEAAQ